MFISYLNHLFSEDRELDEMLDTPNSKKFEDASTKIEEWEQEPRLNDSIDIGKTKKSKCNLRKSLAWDTAFFTSAGIYICYIYLQPWF